MNDLFAGYAHYASTHAVLQERATGAGAAAEEQISWSITYTVSWTWSN